MSVDTIEASEESSSPRELYDIVHGTTTYRITTGTRDIVQDGNLYVATAAARGEIGSATTQSGKELNLTLPIDHALVRRYLQQGVPPKKITVTLRRKFIPSNDIDTRWVGEITSMAVNDEGTEATFRIPSRMSEHMLRVLPNVPVTKLCRHTLYDSRCAISRTGTNPDGLPYETTTTATYVNGREVQFDLSTVPAGNARRADWLEEGELLHVASGERMAIKTQADLNPGVSTVTLVTMQMQIPDLKTGDSIKVYAGCKLDIELHCNPKFANKMRFGGYPQLPDSNPFVPSSYGVGNKT